MSIINNSDEAKSDVVVNKPLQHNQAPSDLSQIVTHKFRYTEDLINEADLIILHPNKHHKVLHNVPPRTTKDIIDTSSTDSYAVLTAIPEWTEKWVDVKCQYSKIYNINGEGLIRKITLIDFPVKGTYFLRANGYNLATASLIDGILTFEIDKPERSKMMSMIVEKALGKHEESVKDRKKYLNINRIDNFEILATVALESHHIIKLEGLFYKEYEGEHLWIPNVIDYDIYPTEQKLYWNHPVKEVIFSMGVNMHLLFRINADLYGPFETTNGILRIGFEGFEKLHLGLQNKYLSEENNRTTLNFTKIYNISVIAYYKPCESFPCGLPCDVTVMTFIYNIYNMFGMKRFAN